MEETEFTAVLNSTSAAQIKKAATKIAKDKLVGYESQLLTALTVLMQKTKSWQAQSAVIKALGITGSDRSLPYLKELATQKFAATVLYRDLAFAIFLLQDLPADELSYTRSILDTSNDQLLAGACAAILFAGYTPNTTDIADIIDAVADRVQNEGQVITPRCYIAAACYCWPATLTRDFLQQCTASSWQGLVDIANDALAGNKTKYVLI
ncbi:hypothetical protein L9G74_05325 [Shewanella sp. C32]|uniref:HEAT repeat domain-containing protein n=1 Tax=Shewanella electrica TaxID=515560 RepID=A0ABT2FHN5_9GAMM|nr:hypothetical protein [Shewanella electrica]MCH1923950.1 hypothetical protein [Shewanella electrica]MCS4555853.1 hypothetical protein [Shewanella electrica]